MMQEQASYRIERSMAGVPVVDLSGEFGAGEEQGRRLARVCAEWGCFRVANHGVPEELLRGMRTAVAELFQAPDEVKRRNVHGDIANSGYMPTSELNPLYEAFGLYDSTSPLAVHDFCSRMKATAHQREIISEYCQHLNAVALDLAGKIAQSLGLDVQDHRSFFHGWTSQFRINRYSFTSDAIGTSGVCAHTDSSFLTVLHEDDHIGGLEVMSPAGEYVPLDPLPGTLVVNLGDIAEVWSNGRFRNLKHRVECKAAGRRISIALFLLGPREGEVEAPSLLVDQEHPRLYRPFSYADYRQLRVSSSSRLGEILQFYRMECSGAPNGSAHA